MRNLILVLIVLLSTGLMVSTCYSTPVSGYNSYINILPGGKDRQAENFNIIDTAQKKVIASEMSRRQREINFIKPIDVVELTPKYLMIAFEVAYKPSGNSRFSPYPAIYSLLFEQDASFGIIKYSSFFIKWLNKSDVEEYKSASKENFRQLFRHLGVDDCVKTAQSAVQTKTSPQKTKKEITIDAKQIVSGIIPEQFIDPEIARKEDLRDALKNNATRELEKKIAALSMGNSKVDSDAIDSLKTRLAEEKRMRQKLEKRIATLEALLKNVSLNKNVLTFKGVNVRIVNGTNDIRSKGNGSGNLIMGYIQNGSDDQSVTGLLDSLSHKIISVEEQDDRAKTLLPDYGTGDNSEEKSILRFLLN